jgi:pyruvate formate lyase activating enzyme
MNGYFMEPQNFSVNDGDGIRTVVFFAGCPLKCKWCANPESTLDFKRVSFNKESCIGCGKCTQICPEGLNIDLNSTGQREKCTSCSICVENCPTGSRKNLVRMYSDIEMLDIIKSQEIFYRYSNGGVTFSGGEATLQQDILRILVNSLYDRAVNMALETSGYFVFDEVKDILARLDLIFVDIKHMNEKKHELYTGKSNKNILENIKKMNMLGVPIVVRIPVIDGVNSDEDNIKKTAVFVRENIKNPKIELLPYHNFADEKYEYLGLEKMSDNFKRPSNELLSNLKMIIKNEGAESVSYV